MFTSSRINDWLGLLNYQVIHCDRYALFPMTRYRTMWTWLENSLGIGLLRRGACTISSLVNERTLSSQSNHIGV